MEESKTEGYVAGAISTLFGVILLAISGWNIIMIIFGAFFGILGGLSIWKPDSAGKVTSQILKNISENMEQDKPRRKKESKINQTIVNSGTVINVTGSDHTSTTVNTPKKQRKKPSAKE